MEYNELKEYWETYFKENLSIEFEGLIPGNFHIYFYEACGGGPWNFCIRDVIYFDDWKNCLAYYRFAEIPRILDLDSLENSESDDIKNAEFYIKKYPSEKQKIFLELINFLDEFIKSNHFSKEKFEKFVKWYNNIFDFGVTEHTNGILSWGTIKDILLAEELREDLKDEAAREKKQKENKGRATELKKLLDNNAFDENNKEHLDLAKGFLESYISG